MKKLDCGKSVLSVVEVNQLARHFYFMQNTLKDLISIHAIVELNRFLEFPFTTELRWSDLSGEIYVSEGFAHEQRSYPLTQDRLDTYFIREDRLSELTEILKILNSTTKELSTNEKLK